MNLLMLLLVALAVLGAGALLVRAAAMPEPKRIRVEDRRTGPRRLD